MLSTLPAPTSQGFGKTTGYGAGAAHSRSTSAGSSLSDGRSSLDLQKQLLPLRNVQTDLESSPVWSPSFRPENAPVENPLYNMDAFWLPEHDYTSPWSIQQTSPLVDIDYQVPIGTTTWQPRSLEGFYEEWQAQSCPASGIGLPPGLEDLLSPADVAANLVAAEATLQQLDASETNEALHHLPNGLLDLLDPEAPQFLPTSLQQATPLDPEAAEFVPPSMQQPLALGASAKPYEIERQLASYPSFHEMFLDSRLATQPPQAEHQPMPFDLHFAVSGVPPPPVTWTAQPTSVLQESKLGGLGCPTVGSQDHHLGTCRPCAFMFTRGCNNGVLCQFCHLCDVGERKRRSKVKRSDKRMGGEWVC